MFKATVDRVCCPVVRRGKACRGKLEILSAEGDPDIEYGSLQCRQCRAGFPVVAGVAILVPEVDEYFFHHAKGIAKTVPEERIPGAFRDAFLEHRDEVLQQSGEEHIEEDLESGRVNALYLMTHYLGVGGGDPWWKSTPSSESPWVTEWIEKYWDQGPLTRVSGWLVDQPGESRSIVELGCGVGGLLRRIASHHPGYLGVDSSFHSIRIARHLNLGASMNEELRIPGDLFHGNLYRPLGVAPRNLVRETAGDFDFVAGVLEALPLADASFDGSVCLNAIDMLDEPKILPEAQARIVRSGGFAIQCAPYIWHERVSRGLRGRAPKGIQDSKAAVEWLYRKAGFEIEKSEAHIPWLFFKHLRQIELYSVHGFLARKL